AALDAASRARSLDPGNLAASGLVAELEADAGELAAARVTLADTLLRHPGNPALLMQSAWTAQRAGDLHAAIDTYTRLLALQPNNGAALSQLVFCRKQLLDWSGLDELQQRFRHEVAKGTALLTPFSFLSDPSTRAEQRQCAKTWGEGFIPDEVLRPAPPAAETPSWRLRIGYLSGDFYEHPTAVLLAGVLERHDRARFEVFAYSTGPDDGSAMRARVIAACEHFADLRERRTEAIAARIAGDRLDVLVDLKGYTEGAPTAALALRPAPVQAHWVGYPGTLAAPFIDYLLVDRIVAPPQHVADYAEALVWLPDACQPNDRSRIAAAAPSRQSLGLRDTDIVLASFNAAWKLNPPVFDAWARILASTPRSVLWLMARNGTDPGIANARREMANRGIGSERIVFATRRAQPAYLALYLHADLFLDTWPYNAHTTASDALWMGCPVVTWLGDTFAGRVGASLVNAAGLGELATDSVAAYIELAIALANDAARRASLRVRLAEARTHSPLFDADAMALHVERAYETMVEQHRSGVVASFEVPRG
ncbi:MAG: glycosyltransferase, partial [Casimicrobiaceae bacterium]